MILYIHIPFCTSRCGYCAFNTFSGQENLILPYVNALLLDLKNSAQILKNHKNPEIFSIFFGGGTPNTLDFTHFSRIFDCIFKNFQVAKNCEITSEANPNLLTKIWCENLHAMGLNRVSIGIQSFFSDKLSYLQREHTYENIFDAIKIAERAGILNLSVDLMYNTPLDTLSRIKSEVAQLKNLPINHVSAYSLELERPHLQNSTTDFSDDFRAELADLGFAQYEVSNFSRGYKCEHNLAYWRGENYLGCGAGAIGKMPSNSGSTRLYTHKNLKNYIKNPIHRISEILDKNALKTEEIFLGLRCEIGVKTKNLDAKKVEILTDPKDPRCFVKNDRIFANDFFLADEIAVFLMD